ncbi:MAG TPA: hypothetical protein VNT33_03325 [Telluria sp.]|nr:hypothetical protein [Telluria sp.]
MDETAGCQAKAGERLRGAPTMRDLRQASGEAVEHDRVTSRRLARVREEEGRRRATAPGAKGS